MKKYIFGAIIITVFLATTAEAKPNKFIPKKYHGIWIVEMASDDGGKTVILAKKNEILCTVYQNKAVMTTGIKMKVLGVMFGNKDKTGNLSCHIGFDNGVVWTISKFKAAGMIHTLLQVRKYPSLKEIVRFVIRINT